VETQHRKADRDQREQLLTLVNGWDPAGRLAGGAPRDSYHSLVERLLVFLASNPAREDVATFLETDISENFGAKPEGVPAFANKVVTWYGMGL
jgi:hypothetical protein